VEAPYGSPLNTEIMLEVGNRIPLSSFHSFNTLLFNRQLGLFKRALNSVLKHAYDSGPLKARIIRVVPKHNLEAIRYLSTWDEL
jgi:hypothetical protein